MMQLPQRLYKSAESLIVRFSQVLPFSGRSILLASLLAVTLVSGVKRLGGLQRLELMIFDYLVRLQPDQKEDPRLVIVSVTEDDIRKHGWPLSDAQFAELLATVQAQGPRVVGLDIYRTTGHPPGRAALEKQLAANNLIAITNVGKEDFIPHPDSVPWHRVGFNDLAIDDDGIVRRSLLFVNHPERQYYSFALRVVLAALPDTAINFEQDSEALYLNGYAIPRLQKQSGGYQNLDNRGFQTLLRYRSRQTWSEEVSVSEIADEVSVSDIFEGRFEASQFQDKIVLVGSVAPSLKDQFYTPYTAGRGNNFTMSGVIVHAHSVSQLLDIAEGKMAQYQFLPQWGELIWLVGLSTFTSVLAWKFRRPEMILLIGVGLGGILFTVSWLSLTQLVWLPLVEPTIGVCVAGALVIAQKSIYRSTYDGLTKLPGREIFLLYVKRALNARNSKPVIVAFLDIDRFQIINKSLGHYAGDRLLYAISKRLTKTLGEHAKIARVGGDEFAILFQNNSQKSAKAFLDEMRSVLSKPLMLGKHRLSITASVGLAITQTKYSQMPEDLLRDAHTAMYRAKALKEAQYQVFSDDMREEAVARLDLESDLIRALENDEFSLFYQPIINIQTGAIAGFEALLRWRHENRGLISPNQFIPIVEENGMIIPLGEWILKTACQQAKVWLEQFPGRALKMSINLSRRQFDQPDLCHKIARILSQSNLPGDCIQLEITESMIMRDVEAAHALMMRLKELGIQLAIDDFGTGYSSLSYLHRFPTDTLKVDRSFVSRMEKSSEDREIVQTIIDLGHKLNMNLVAEGISSSHQLTLLKEVNCQFGQGYYFSKPLPTKEATALLEEKPVWLATAV